MHLTIPNREVALRIMRISFLQCLIAVSFLQLSRAEDGKAQELMNRPVILSVREEPLETVLSQLERQSGTTFLYSRQVIDSQRKISFATSGEKLSKVLDQVLKPLNLKYEVMGSQVIIKRDFQEVKIPQSSLEEYPVISFPVIRISGKVADEKGEPLPGVSILVKGTQQGMITDASGKFIIEVPGEHSVLVFSFVGYLSQEVPVAGRAVLDITLKVDEKALEEVVVVGYGTQKKVNLTGAVATISGDALVNRPVTGTVDALQGMMPGVVVTKSTGSPGRENYSIRVRGMTSATNNPVLVLVDGIEGNINDVRPEDVESISVLKDAASASIYGARAAGGVVLITTKRCKSGAVSVEYSSHYTASKLGRTQERISSYQAAVIRNEADINAGGSAQLSAADLARLADPDILWDRDPVNPNQYRYWGDYDYQKLLLRAYTPMTSHNIAISGGSDKTTFRLSGTYYKNNGSIKIGPDSDTRYSGRLNLNTQINRYLELANVLSYSHNRIEKPRQDTDGNYNFWSYVFTYPGVTPLYDPNGNIASGVRVGQFDGRIKFYQFDYERGLQSWNDNNLRANSTLTIKNIAKNLQFRIVGGIDGNFNGRFLHSKIIEHFGIDGTVLENLTGGNVQKSQANSTFKEFQFLTDYNIQAGNHGLSLFGGYSFQDYHYRYFEGYIQDLVNENLPSFNWADQTNRRLSDDAASYRYQSFFGRLQYNYGDRYLFETNVRYDGSSKLNPQDRYRLFPSASAAWRISKENWFSVGFVNELKIRGSVGQLGNANAIGNYDYIPLLSVNNDLILGSSGGAEQRVQYISQNQLASRNITWETVQSSNIGLELGLFGNRLSVEGDYYVKRNKNMLAAVAFPSVLGIGVGNQNVGELKTWGWETILTWRENKGAFSYWISANIDDSRNKLIEYLGATVIQPGTRRLLENYPINSIFGYKTDGLFQTQEEVDNHAFQNSQTRPGDVRYIDMNGDGKIDPGRQSEDDHGDLVYLGDSNPRYNFGVRGGFNWKGFEFSIFLQGVGKRVIMLENALIMPFYRAEFGPQRHQLDYWTPENRDAFWPRMMVRGEHNYLPSDKWIQNAAYLRIKDIQLGYTLPNRWLSGLGVKNLRLYLAGRDIWEITGVLDVIDPETPNQATYQYPFRRSYTAGLNLNF